MSTTAWREDYQAFRWNTASRNSSSSNSNSNGSSNKRNQHYRNKWHHHHHQQQQQQRESIKRLNSAVAVPMPITTTTATATATTTTTLKEKSSVVVALLLQQHHQQQQQHQPPLKQRIIVASTPIKLVPQHLWNTMMDDIKATSPDYSDLNAIMSMIQKCYWKCEDDNHINRQQKPHTFGNIRYDANDPDAYYINRNISFKQFCLKVIKSIPQLNKYCSTSAYMKVYDAYMNYRCNRQAVGAILLSELHNNKRYLLLVRSYRSGRWSFPRGKLENNESLLECARREVLEETSFDIASSFPESTLTSTTTPTTPPSPSSSSPLPYIEVFDKLNLPKTRLYLVTNVPFDDDKAAAAENAAVGVLRSQRYKPKTAFEISECCWFELEYLYNLCLSMNHTIVPPSIQSNIMRLKEPTYYRHFLDSIALYGSSKSTLMCCADQVAGVTTTAMDDQFQIKTTIIAQTQQQRNSNIVDQENKPPARGEEASSSVEATSVFWLKTIRRHSCHNRAVRCAEPENCKRQQEMYEFAIVWPSLLKFIDVVIGNDKTNEYDNLNNSNSNNNNNIISNIVCCE